MECLHNRPGGGGGTPGILDRVVPHGSLNPDPISDQKFHFLHPFSDQNSTKTIPFGAAWHI